MIYLKMAIQKDFAVTIHQHLTCYLNQDWGADCLGRLGHAGVITSVCRCSRADIQDQGHIGEDGGNIDKGHFALRDENS